MYKKKSGAAKYRPYKELHKNHCVVNDSNLQIEIPEDLEAQDIFSTVYLYYIEKIKKESSKDKKNNNGEIAASKEKLLSMIEMRKKIISAYDDVYSEE